MSIYRRADSTHFNILPPLIKNCDGCVFFKKKGNLHVVVNKQ